MIATLLWGRGSSKHLGTWVVSPMPRTPVCTGGGRTFSCCFIAAAVMCFVSFLRHMGGWVQQPFFPHRGLCRGDASGGRAAEPDARGPAAATGDECVSRQRLYQAVSAGASGVALSSRNFLAVCSLSVISGPLRP